MTASYDGSVRLMDPVTATFQLLVTDEEAEFSALDCLADASSGSALLQSPLLHLWLIVDFIITCLGPGAGQGMHHHTSQREFA